MEIHPGMFLSNLGTSEWRPDADVGGEVHVVVEGEDGYVGISRFVDAATVGPWAVPVRESFVVVEGAGRLVVQDGPTVDLGPGVIVSIPAGAVATWHLTRLPYQELWFYARAFDAGA